MCDWGGILITVGCENGRPQKDFIFPSLLRCANTPSGKYKVFLGAGYWNASTLLFARSYSLDSSLG